MLRALVELQRNGIEPRHLRGFRAAAEREIGLIETALVPIARRNDVSQQGADRPSSPARSRASSTWSAAASSAPRSPGSSRDARPVHATASTRRGRKRGCRCPATAAWVPWMKRLDHEARSDIRARGDHMSELSRDNDACPVRYGPAVHRRASRDGRRQRLPRRCRRPRGRHLLPPAGLLGPHRARRADRARCGRLRLAAPLRLPRHPRAQARQAPARHRHLAPADPHRGQPAARVRRQRPRPDHADERRRERLPVHVERRGHRPGQPRPGRLRHRRRQGAPRGGVEPRRARHADRRHGRARRPSRLSRRS